MDDLERRLKDDAERIRVEVSPELDERIRASLEATAPLRPVPTSRPRWFWWASSLTGVAGALAVIALLNLGRQPEAPPAVAAQPLLRPALDVRPAVMLGPLESELDNLKRDLARAEAVVREDVDQILVDP